MFDFEILGFDKDDYDVLEETMEDVEELAYIFNMTEEEVLDMLLNMDLM